MKKLLSPALLLILAWLGSAILINPLGNFPLNDDWAYAWSVKETLIQGKPVFSGWISTTFISQWTYGLLLTSIAGFSFNVLRLSTVALGIGAILFLYGIMRIKGQDPLIAILICLLLGWNPLFLHLSYTFMTDIPFLFFQTGAFYFYFRSKQTDPGGSVGSAFIFMQIASILCRQTGLIMIMPFLIHDYLKEKSRRVLIQLVLICFILPLFYLLIRLMGTEPGRMHGINSSLLRYLHPDITFIKEITWKALFMLGSLGVFLLPFLNLERNRKFLWIYLSALGLGLFMAWKGFTFPYLGNTFHYNGLGVFSLKDHDILHQLKDIQIPKLAIILNILGFMTLGTLLFQLSRHWSSKMNPVLLAFSVYAILLLPTPLYDRYLLPLLLLALIMISDLPWKVSPVISGVFIIIQGCFSISGTHDMLAWNRLRWEMVKELDPMKTDAGFEYGGWNNYGKVDAQLGKSWWWVKEDKYLISFTPVEDYRILKADSVRQWSLPGTYRRLYLSEKIKD